jgi:hypothetical protein
MEIKSSGKKPEARIVKIIGNEKIVNQEFIE